MPKIIFENKREIPEHLRDDAKESEDGTFELDATGILNKNRELLSDNANLKTKNEDLRLQSQAFEGKVAVEPEIEKLGFAAKNAGLKQTEISTLKTENADLKNKIETSERAQKIETAAKVAGFNEKFTALAKDKNLDFEIVSEGEGDKKTEVAYVVTEKDGATVKTKVDDFVKADSFFSAFADTFQSEGQAEQGKKWVSQESGKDKKPKDLVAQEVDAARATGRYGL